MADYKNTYSELVDEIVTTSGREDKLADIKSYVNQVVRDCQVLANFYRDLVEDQITMDASDPFIWDPLPVNFRLLRSVLYPGLGIYPQNKPPGRIQADLEEYYYVAANYATFKGCGAEDEIDVAYYTYCQRLSYYASGARPALWDAVAASWSYLSGGVYVSTLGTAALNEAAQAKVTNWVIFTWYDMVKDGTFSKLYYVLDDPRGPKHLGLYKSSQASLLKGETFESMNV